MPFSCRFLLNGECQISNHRCKKSDKCICYNVCTECKYKNYSFLSDKCAGCSAVGSKNETRNTTEC